MSDAAVIACGALAFDVRSIARRRGWDVEVVPVPALLHNRPERIAPAVAAEIAALRSRYRIQAENGPVSGIAWAPDGSRLAYRLGASSLDRAKIRVRSLTGAARTATLATGEVGNPAWLADSIGGLIATGAP